MINTNTAVMLMIQVAPIECEELGLLGLVHDVSCFQAEQLAEDRRLEDPAVFGALERAVGKLVGAEQHR
jgi:hypothetical protein